MKAHKMHWLWNVDTKIERKRALYAEAREKGKKMRNGGKDQREGFLDF